MGLFDNLFAMFSSDLAIDLGTANTLIYLKGKGVTLSEPSVISVDKKTGTPIAFGTEAKKMLERTPENIEAIRPMKDGVIADFEYAEQMIKYFIKNVINKKLLSKPVIVVCVPANVTQVEKRAVKDSIFQAGARKVYLVSEPMAAAIGAGLPIQDPSGNMIIDIGGGTTEIAVISLAGIVYSNSVKTGGDEMDDAIITYVRKKYNLLIGPLTAENIKKDIGSASIEDSDKKIMELKGRDMITGIPSTIEVSSEDIYESLQNSVFKIVEGIRVALEKTPPELSADIVDRGIVLTGGGALLKNLDKAVSTATKLPVILHDEPLNAVVLGVGKALDNIELLKKIEIQ